MAAWETVYIVHADGNQVLTREARRTAFRVTIRGDCGRSHSFPPAAFELACATTPRAAVEKFLAAQEAAIGNTQARLDLLRLLRDRARALLERTP